MEQLNVENFLVIKKANFDIGNINVIIGPQANGKSLLAKLLYFARESIRERLLLSIKNNERKQEYIKGIEKAFEKYFPKYTWKDKEFSIEYLYENYRLSISKRSTQQRTVSVELSDELSALLRSLRSQYKTFQKRTQQDEILLNEFYEFKREYIFSDTELSKLFNESVFIPASRSFFANLQKNIFSFLSKNIDIDPFISEFGSQYEFAKKIYADEIFQNTWNGRPEFYNKIKTIAEKVLSGSYRYQDDQDWIVMKEELVNLSNASSGQQEALPMLLVLAILPFIGMNKDGKFYFLEEPEAHLFPISQKHIVSLIALIYHHRQRSVITTHSPYILTAFNNYIYAYDIAQKYGENRIEGIVDKEFCINYDDFRAYTIEKGKLKSIKDDETRLIGMNIIDAVSDEFSMVFDKLIEADMQ